MSVDRILLVSLDNLGDLVFASALAPPLRERFPHATHRRLVQGVHGRRGAAGARSRRRDRRRSVLGPSRPGRRQGLATALPSSVDATCAPTATTSRCSRQRRGAPRPRSQRRAFHVRIGLRGERTGSFLTDALPDENRTTSRCSSEQARLLEPLGIEPPALRYRLDPASLRDRRARLTTGSPGHSSHSIRSRASRIAALRLPIWIELARRLRASRHRTSLWVGSPSELDSTARTRERSRWRFVDRDSDGSLADTAAALAGATLFVGHDSGPLHVAGAFGVPVVGVFAPG